MANKQETKNIKKEIKQKDVGEKEIKPENKKIKKVENTNKTTTKKNATKGTSNKNTNSNQQTSKNTKNKQKTSKSAENKQKTNKTVNKKENEKTSKKQENIENKEKDKKVVTKKQEQKNKKGKTVEQKELGDKEDKAVAPKEKVIKLEEIKETLKKKKNIPKEETEKINKVLFRNIIIAILIIIYFIFLNLGQINIKAEVYQTDLKVFSMCTLILAIVLIENAYKKDSGEIALYGIEMIILSIITLALIYVNLIFSSRYAYIISAISYIFAAYYLIKSMVIYIRRRKKYFVDDIKEIMDKEEE